MTIDGRPRDRRRQLGDAGERRVSEWYRRRGYRVEARNWRSRHGELDLVLTRRGEVVFCEVKTRTSRRFGHPAEAVTPAKQERIRGLALEWMAATGVRRGRIRFDVATVEGRWVEVRRSAF
ncbi:MAG: YraN family protein [Actinomycetota bacterium]